MRIDDNSIGFIITFLESGDEKDLNTFINLTLYPDEDMNKDFSSLIETIKGLPNKDIKSIQKLLKPKKSNSNTLDYLDDRAINVEKNEDFETTQLISEVSDSIDEILEQIKSVKYLDNSEKNILSSFYDNNLMDNYTRSLSKKMYFYILRTAQLKFHLFKD